MVNAALILLWYSEHRIRGENLSTAVGKFGTNKFNKDDSSHFKRIKPTMKTGGPPDQRPKLRLDTALLQKYCTGIHADWCHSVYIIAKLIHWKMLVQEENKIKSSCVCVIQTTLNSNHRSIFTRTRLLSYTVDLALTTQCPPPDCCSADNSPVDQKVERAPGFHQLNEWHCGWSKSM